MLNHPLDEIKFRNSEYDNQDDICEFQANIFARDLLAPACVLKELRITTVEQIMKLCNISRVSAELRLKRMHELYKRRAFYTSPLERAVLKQFQPFIDTYWQQQK
ncbi:MAG: ImmA/IrrE family metallo-endopeptidase [Epulopiscium sp.]|nr:ImmA/IrrE family metallo-endopeptidase [Candidatus Epulonipiscium sp.]